MQRYEYFLDLDGVIVNFLESAFKKHGVYRPIKDIWPKGQWGSDETLTLLADVGTIDEFWDRLGYTFWATLPMMDDADHILDIVEPLNPCILTSPARGSAGGKQHWIMKHLPQYYSQGRYLIGPAKDRVAGPGRVLLDDSEENITNWVKRGGIGLLVPRYWNRLYCMSQLASIYVYQRINELETTNHEEECINRSGADPACLEGLA